MADPICRWRNTSIKQVSEFTQVLPHCPMRKDAARAFVEKQWHEWDGGNDFFRTPYQLAAQLGLYYEDDTMFYPRFDHILSIDEARRYIEGWIRRYYIPNPYTGSIHYDGQPIVLNSQLYQAALSGESKLDEFFRSHLNIDLGNKDILTNILNNFSDIKVENGRFSIKKEAIVGVLISQNKSDDKKAFFDTFNDIQIGELKVNSADNLSRQIIYYGAPGTGKSHKIKKQLDGISKENIFRTTFHPDSDYSTFVGAYKPTMKKQYRYEGKVKASYYEDDDLANAKKGDPVVEKAIEYNFIPQVFLNAYIRAYKTDENVYLIIEEINRGNCAQIFGDLFQLLDRDENGKSEYTIKADADLRTFLEDNLGCDNPGIKDGELCLPSNLYIYATMNTSDQSLFPIDSAFKRRWDWEYEPIKNKNTDWVIDIDGLKYRWSDFQKEVNARILNNTGSEDKMLGDYFVNPPAKIISYNLFRNKILFYLWNDVCKDGDADIFPTDADFSFSKLYNEDSKQLIVSIMEKLHLEPIDGTVSENKEDGSDISEDNDSNSSSVRYSINGEETDEKGKTWGKGALVKRAVEIFCQNNPDLSAKDIRDRWISVGFKIPHIVETEDDKKKRLNGSVDKTGRERCKPIKLTNEEFVYVSTEVGSDKVYNNFEDFLSRIKSRPEWGIEIKEL
ncbi:MULTISPECIES: AAA family ATPase [Butyricimonas]|nr:AAA family ATPase [Butyricimonas faecalis]